MASDKPITRERLLRILDDQAAKTARAIAGLDEATLNLPAREDGWTAKEILAHMIGAHDGFCLVAQGRLPGEYGGTAFDLNAYNEAQRVACRDLPVAEVLARLEAARGRMRAYIEQVDEAEFQQVVHTPWMGDHPKGQFLIYPALHEGGHRAELERWRAALHTEKV